MKTCVRCNNQKLETEFHKAPRAKDKLHPWCKSCSISNRMRYYHENKEKHRAYNNERIKQNKQKLLNFFLENHCIDCGESDPIVLDFDHLRDKKYQVPQMIRYGMKWDSILEEIAKCEVVCSNCHRRRTAKRAGNWFRS